MAGQKFNIYLDEKLIKDIKKLAIDQDTSASKIIDKLLKEYIAKHSKK